MITILCVTKNEPHAASFLAGFRALAEGLRGEFVLAFDGDGPCDGATIRVKSRGYIESVLEEAVSVCHGNYILRLDDDERCSPAMREWLFRRAYEQADHWKFPRVHLWPNERSALMTPHLFPDWQTRLSVKMKSGGRHTVHAGSPFGGGEEAPVAIEHHKFLVRSRAERLEIAKRYDAFSPGYGTGNMKPFSLPEDAYDEVKVVGYTDGHVPWEPAWSRMKNMRAMA